MALDGCTLYLLRQELQAALLNTRVEKIYQPAKEELVLVLKGRQGSHKLYLCANANCPRAGLVTAEIANPKTPPSFCLLLRKHLGSARLIKIEQPGGLERVLSFVFETRNEMGDPICLTLVAELMGRHSNLTLVNESGKIMDAIRRVDMTVSAARQLLPGLMFQLPPAQQKQNLLLCSPVALAEAILAQGTAGEKAVMAVLQGVSPIVARELVHLLGYDATAPLPKDAATAQRLAALLEALATTLKEGKGTPTLVFVQGEPKDVTFLPVAQYGSLGACQAFENFSCLVEAFYGRQSNTARARQRAKDLCQWLETAISRTAHKLERQRADLAETANRQSYKEYGDLIAANLYRVQKGDAFLEAENFYQNNQPVSVLLDETLSPTENMQLYYKKYKKATTAAQMLQEQLTKSAAELEYFESVLDLVHRAGGDDEVIALRQELQEQGYLHRRAKEQKAAAKAPHTYRSTDGFLILSGRNNLQNDQLTLRKSAKEDLWFHTKEIPGSHTVVVTEGKSVPQQTLLEAAMLAAWHSKGQNSSGVPVDYTQIRHVKKPSGAKPGKVIYDHHSTLYVTPDPALAQQLRVQK